MGADAKYVIDFDHHGERLRDHNTEQLHELMYNEAGRPLGWSNHHDGFWAIWGYDALYDAVQDWETFSSGHSVQRRKGAPGAMYDDALIPIDLDGPVQQDFRKLVLNWFNPGHAKSMAVRVQEMCDDLIDEFIERGEAELSYELFTALPAMFTLEMLDWESTRWREWVNWVHGMIHDSIVDPEGSMECINNLYTNIGMEIARRREQLGDDLFSDMMRTPMGDGRTMTDEELTNFALLVLLGGMDTTAGTTGNSLLLIDRDPELRQQLIDNVDQMPTIIEEFLRVAGPGGGLYRRLTEDVEFHGEKMHEDEVVLMMFWAANRDPKAFPDPEKIDIFRTRNRHMAFGLGPHRCLGSHHARLMLSTMFRAIFTRLPDFEVQWDGVKRFEDCGSVYGVRYLPVTFTPGPRLKPA